MEICVVCNHTCINTPYYKTEHGCVCEDCFESSVGTVSAYEEWKGDNK